MKFTPKTEKEVQNLMPDGIVFFEVLDACNDVSAKGNDMLVLDVRIYNEDQSKKVKDYLVSGIDAMAYKIRHLAEAIGCMAEYEAGELTPEMVTGGHGQCKIGTQEEQNGFPAKNVIRDYVKPTLTAAGVAKEVKAEKAKAAKKAPADDDMDQAIPF